MIFHWDLELSKQRAQATTIDILRHHFMFRKKLQSCIGCSLFVGRHWFLAVADVVLLLIYRSYVKYDEEDVGLVVHLNLRLFLVGGLAWLLPYLEITKFGEFENHGWMFTWKATSNRERKRIQEDANMVTISRNCERNWEFLIEIWDPTYAYASIYI